MMRNILGIIFLLMFIVGCANRYVEPTQIKNGAKLIINHDKLQADSNFYLVTTVYLDGKLIDLYKYPHLAVYVSPEKHTLTIEITSTHNKGRAKHNISKEYVINFKENQIYKVNAEMITKDLSNLKDNAEAQYEIVGPNIEVKENMVLEDSFLRSPSKASNQQMQKTVTDAVIQTVIIPAM